MVFVLCKELVYIWVEPYHQSVVCCIEHTIAEVFNPLKIIPLLQDGIILREEEVTRGLCSIMCVNQRMRGGGGYFLDQNILDHVGNTITSYLDGI